MTFAAVVAGVVAVYNILSGIAAITEDDQTEAINEVLYGVDITAWGWFWLVIGALQLLTAVLIYQRNPTGQVLGIIWAFIAASLSVFMIFVAPEWALVVLGINLLVLYALVAQTEEFARGVSPNGDREAPPAGPAVAGGPVSTPPGGESPPPAGGDSGG
ncbi:MAG: DUF7144 family membrane protein [Acidimicrobiales bacterium]